MTPTIALLLGAGASKPLGIPTTDEMAKEFLEETQNQTLKKIINDTTNEPDIETVIQIVRRVKELPKNEGLSLLNDATIIPKFENFSIEFTKTENELTQFIRKKCLEPDLEKSSKNYSSLLNLGDVADVNIFTTNYDTAVENVCNAKDIEYNDGFRYSKRDGYPILDSSLFEKGDIRIYKLHGSVDWWSDTTRRKIFRLKLELDGVKNVNNLMIYPAQKEDVFNYPFNILQSILIKTLDYVDEFIVIGHKFADLNIVSAIRVVLEQRSNFRLTIVNKSASKIKKTIFDNNEKVDAYDETIENWLPNAMKKYHKTAEKKLAESKEEKERKDKEIEDKIIREYESSKRPSMSNLVIESSDPFIPGSISKQSLGDIPIVSSKAYILGSGFQHQCPKCGNMFNQATLTGKYECPSCHHTF